MAAGSGSRRSGGGRGTSGLRLRRISGHVTVTARDVYAWYRLPIQGWSFRPDSAREALITAGADTLARLVGRRLHLRTTSRPFPLHAWAMAHDANAPAPLPVWPDYLIGQQQHLASKTLAEKDVFLGVEIPARVGVQRSIGRVVGPLLDHEVAGLSPRIRETDQLMAGPGLGALPVTAREMEWLMARSCGLGLPAPASLGAVDSGEWASEDLDEITGVIRWTAVPFGRTLTVTGDRNGTLVERHVCVLSVGRMSDLEIPPGVPWMYRTDRLPFAVEWSARLRVMEGQRVVAAMRRNITKIRAQKNHYEVEHGEPSPVSLDRQASKALIVEDEISSGLSGLSTRTEGHYRLAVWGATQAEALERAEMVRRLYSPGVTIARPVDQYDVAREFIPGEPLGTTAHLRRMPVTTVAAAVPAAGARVGDRIGIPLGRLSGNARRQVMWEPWASTERREESGLAVLLAGLGGGKSTCIGSIVYRTVIQGVPWSVLDPSGRLTALCRLPELAPWSRVVDLLDAAPGVLCTYRVIADPRREHFTGDAEWRQAQAAAGETRKLLTTNVLRSLLPAAFADHVLTEVALMRAVSAVHPTSTASPRFVVKALRHLRGDDELTRHAGYIADLLDEIAGTTYGRLIFPAGYQHDDVQQAEPLLTVYSLRGLALPDEHGGSRSSMDIDERLSMAVLYLAAWLTQRGMYFGDVHSRKGIAIDEAWALGTFSTGRRFIETSSRDSRKHNTRVLLASQNPSDLLRLGVANLVSTAFVGRLSDVDAQRDALAFLPDVAPDQGYESIIGSLSAHAETAGDAGDAVGGGRRGAREFVFSDGAGGVERIRLELDSLPAVLDALDTTADPTRSKDRLRRDGGGSGRHVDPETAPDGLALTGPPGPRPGTVPTPTGAVHTGPLDVIDLRDDLPAGGQDGFAEEFPDASALGWPETPSARGTAGPFPATAPRPRDARPEV